MKKNPPQTRRRQTEDVDLGPRKKLCLADPLVRHGRHFGRTVHALCSVKALLTNGSARLGELAEKPEESFTSEERHDHRTFQSLLQMVPGLANRITEGPEDEIVRVAELIQKGIDCARYDDTKSLKGAILDWIMPAGQPLDPPLSRSTKIDRGFHHERTGALLCPTGLDWTNAEVKERLRSGEMYIRGDQWPIFLYHEYNYDPEDPWNGLFRSSILVMAYKYVFTSPSSVDKEPKATRSSNARIHGMTRVTPSSIAYIATQVQFALSSSPVFSRTDMAIDSEGFYTTMVDLFEDIGEKEEVENLLGWWNGQIFPSYATATNSAIMSKNSVVANIKAKRAALKARQVAQGLVEKIPCDFGDSAVV